MQVNVNKLRGIIVERNTPQEAVADHMGINRSTFYRKLKTGGNTFTVEEVQKMVEAIPLSNDEAIAIFFSPVVANVRQN